MLQLSLQLLNTLLMVTKPYWNFSFTTVATLEYQGLFFSVLLVPTTNIRNPLPCLSWATTAPSMASLIELRFTSHSFWPRSMSSGTRHQTLRRRLPPVTKAPSSMASFTNYANKAVYTLLAPSRQPLCPSAPSLLSALRAVGQTS